MAPVGLLEALCVRPPPVGFRFLIVTPRFGNETEDEFSEMSYLRGACDVRVRAMKASMKGVAWNLVQME